MAYTQPASSLVGPSLPPPHPAGWAGLAHSDGELMYKGEEQVNKRNSVLARRSKCCGWRAVRERGDARRDSCWMGTGLEFPTDAVCAAGLAGQALMVAEELQPLLRRRRPVKPFRLLHPSPQGATGLRYRCGEPRNPCWLRSDPVHLSFWVMPSYLRCRANGALRGK